MSEEKAKATLVVLSGQGDTEIFLFDETGTKWVEDGTLPDNWKELAQKEFDEDPVEDNFEKFCESIKYYSESDRDDAWNDRALMGRWIAKANAWSFMEIQKELDKYEIVDELVGYIY